MAVIGHAEIVVRAITNNFEKELKSTLSNISKSVSVGAGRQIGDGFADGFNRSNASTVFGKVSDGLRSMVPEAEAARERFQSLVRTGFVLQGALGLVAGAISSVVVSIGPLIGSLLAAAPAAVVLANGLVAIQLASRVGKAAFGDIAGAVSNATKSQGGYNRSLEDAVEKLRQLKFEAEEAALSQDRAALNLEKARENLIRSQEMPANSRERREAELEFREAELAYRRAKDRNNQTKKEIAKGVKGQMSATGAGADPFAGLNSAQRAFAQYLVKLQPRFARLELALSKAFLRPLRKATDLLMDELMPVLEDQLPGIAKTTGEALKGIAVEASTPENAARLATIFKNSNPIIKKVGDILENLLTSVLTILEASDGVATQFFTWLDTLTGGWADSLEVMGQNGSLKKFFDDAGVEAAKWGTIIGNIFDGFINLMELTTGPGSAGEYMLDWFTEASEGFKNMFADDPEAGKKFFKDAMINARSVLSSIGALVKEVLGVADNPNIAVAFDKLKEGAPSIGTMLDQMIDAAPSFAGLIVTITKIMEAFTDDGQLKGFFDTLNVAAGKLLEFVQSPEFKTLLDNIGPLLGVLSAVGVVMDAIQFAFSVLIGYLAFMAVGAEKFLAPITKAKDNIKTLVKTKPLGAGVSGPMTAAQAKQADMFKNIGKGLKAGGILGIVLLLVEKAIEFYNKFFDFRQMVDRTFGDLGKKVEELFAEIGKLFDVLFGGDGIGGIFDALDPIIKFLLEILIPVIGFAFGGLIDGAKLVVSVITNVVKAILTPIKTIIQGLMLLFDDPILALQVMIGGVVQALVGIIDVGVNSIIDFLNFVLDRVESTIRTIGNTPLGDLARDLFGLDLKSFSIERIQKIDIAGAIGKNIQAGLDRKKNEDIKKNFSTGTRDSKIPKLASGGVAYPSLGGTLVTVAEAGRPERIEPLDPNGLSNRDKAMIQELSGGSMSGVNVNVYATPGMDVNELTQAISRKLAMEIKRGSI
ncbi:MAG: hypothetical protein EBS38_01390 [Actinobacteria bacterium]|nr:hypothetical protein [Actinomycetota bacterium]